MNQANFSGFLFLLNLEGADKIQCFSVGISLGQCFLSESGKSSPAASGSIAEQVM